MAKKMLAILESPHKDGATGTMLQYAVSLAKQQGWQVDFIDLYEKKIYFCKGCRVCIETKNCIQKDDIQEIADLLRACDLVVLAAPVYWANVPAVVKNMFDRLLGVVMEETKTFPKGRLSHTQRYVLLTACNTQAPFSYLFGQSRGAVKSMKEFFKTSGMRYKGKCVWTGKNKKVMPQRIKNNIRAFIR